MALDRYKIEARPPLHRREFDESDGVLGDFLLQEDEAPELVDEEIREEVVRTHVALRVLHPLERIEPEVGEDRCIEMDGSPDPTLGLVDQPVFPIVDANRAQGALGEVEDFMAV